MIMKTNNLEVFDTKIFIIINNNLYKKKIIDENTYTRINDRLLLRLKNYSISWDNDKI